MNNVINNLRKGLTVFRGNERFGTIEDVRDDQVYIDGRAYPVRAFSRYENNNLYFADDYRFDNAQTGYAQAANQNTINVPVAEEQLQVGKREVQAGEVELQKRVVSEQVNVPVELRREEVRVEEHDLPDRVLRAGEADQLFQEGTIRVPLTAEEAVVQKQAVVTGEVVLNKDVQTQRQNVSDTVRKEQVEVVRDQANTQYGGVREATTTTDYDTTRSTATTTNTGAVRPTTNDYTSDTAARATSGNYSGQLQEGMEVFGNDQESVGQVKRVRQNDFLIDRPMARDVYAPFSAIQTATGSQVVLNIAASEIGAQGWPNPSLGGGEDSASTNY